MHAEADGLVCGRWLLQFLLKTQCAQQVETSKNKRQALKNGALF